MCSELSLPLSRKRSSHDQKILSEKLENMQLGLEYNDECKMNEILKNLVQFLFFT